MPIKFEAQELQDSVLAFDAGMNAGVMPLLLPSNQLASAVNATVRGTFVQGRPRVRKLTLTYGGDTTLENRFTTGNFQGAGYYKPDNANGQLVGIIGGRFFTVSPTGNVGTVAEPPLHAGFTAYPRPDTQPQAWVWQAEKWMIWTDGLNLPVFYDGTDLTESNYGTPINYTTTNTDPITVPAIGGSVLAITVASAASMVVGDIITIQYHGSWQVLQIVANDVDLLNLTASPVGYVIAGGHTLSWSHIGTQLPPGRMGAYGMGRNWMSLVDGKQFVASDIVGGSSGTVALNYRDAVLNITENLYLAGGGNFTVPGTVGDIKAMRFMATLDTSLGQGPLQVLTAKTVFSCNAPVDRLTWQDITNPILTESLITNGGLSQEGTVTVNGDLVFRSLDGLRSLVLGRRETNTWGTTPISREVENILSQDSQTLLGHTSSVVFNNRLLHTTGGATDDQGVYWRGLVVINLDPVSSLRGKSPSVYDGLWTGLNVLQLVVGDFEGVERCFAFTLNIVSHQIEIWEILKDDAALYDNDTRRVTWEFTFPITFGQKDPKKRQQLRLLDGEIHVDNLLGQVDFEVFYKPDQWPCWVSWHAWQECAKAPDATNPLTANYQAQFRPYMGLGEPSPDPCDETNNRPLREGYSFMVKIRVTGQCRFLGARFAALTTPQPAFAPKVCEPICLAEDEEAVAEAVNSGVRLVDALEAITLNDGTVVPIIGSGQQICQGNYGRVYNITDGKWYDLLAYTENDGTKVPICGQTAHNNPTGP